MMEGRREEGGTEGRVTPGPMPCFGLTAEFSCSYWLKMRERSELFQLDFQRYPLFKQILENDITFLARGEKVRAQKEQVPLQQTFSCCCSSLFRRANTVFVSLFLLIEA